MTLRVRRGVRFAAAVLIITLCSAGAVRAETYETPHGYYTADTELCALCHRSHTAVSTPIMVSDEVGVCYTCHGAAGLGSAYATQLEFAKASRHRLEPSTSAFGPSPKVCSNCHNVHGDRMPTGTPTWVRGLRVAFYPKLLRSRDVTNTIWGDYNEFYSGDAFCAACHASAPAPYSIDTTLYESTAHWTTGTGIGEPASGTRIRCLSCHAEHGSDVAPMLRQITNGATVTANDRTQCYACHTALRTFESTAAYDGSSHGATVGTYTGRALSACQQCHDPHGARDLQGILPKLTRRLEENVCYDCHDSSGPAATDLSSAMPTAGGSARYEAVMALWPAQGPLAARLAVLSQETAGGPPRVLRGPYELTVGGPRSLAVGDIDADGRAEAVVGRGSSLVVARQVALSGLAATQTVATADAADDLALGDVDSDGQLEVVSVSRADDRLSVYGWSGGSLLLAASHATGGSSPSAVAVGDIDGNGRADVAVTNAGSDELAVFIQDGSGALGDPPMTFATESTPTGVAIGDLDSDGSREVVVANSGSDSVRVWSWDSGTLELVGTYATTSTAGAAPRDVAIGELLSGHAGREVAVSLWHETSQSAINVFRSGAATTALTFVQEATTGVGAHSWDLGIADIDGDGDSELAVANAGGYRTTAPSLGVFEPSGGTSLEGQVAYRVGASQDAATRARLAIGDVGSLYPYRHNAGAVERAHESTEVTVAVADRHVECMDCHNVHTSDTSTADAPTSTGSMKGAWGLSVDNGDAGTVPTFAPARPARREYQVCFKCHSSLAGESGPRDVALALNPANASYHPVEAGGTNVGIAAGAWVGTWDSTSRVRCTDCHGIYGAPTPAGPHYSRAPSILRGPYVGAPGNADTVCYRCHRQGAYYDGDESTTSPASRFFGAGYATPQLHSLHLRTERMDCRACHVQHGSATMPHLLRTDIVFTHDATGGANGGGSCAPSGCHDAAGHEYRALYP